MNDKLALEIVNWLKDYATKYNRKAWVVGVSGGVDSALVSTLCAMTGLPTHVVCLPCQSRPDGLDNADKHIGWLHRNFTNVTKHTIDLTPVFEAYAKTTEMYRDGLADANTKSRLRMVALYQIATPISGLVVGTGNKVEDFGVGFFTKYGDGGVDISPISDLMKSEVRQMCRNLGVLPELCEAVPTDGLWSDTRTDETQLGATYDELEWAMNYDSLPDPEYEAPVELTDRQKTVLEIYRARHASSRHKMDPIPTFVRK